MRNPAKYIFCGALTMAVSACNWQIVNRSTPEEFAYHSKHAAVDVTTCSANGWLKHRFGDVDIHTHEGETYSAVQHWPENSERTGDMATLIVREDMGEADIVLIKWEIADPTPWIEAAVERCV